MKKIVLTAALLLLALTSFSQFSNTNPGKSRPNTFRVENTSNPFLSGCPYTVQVSMALFNSSNVIVGGTTVTYTGTINTGASGYYSYPASPAPGYTVKVTAITTWINSSAVSLPVTGSSINFGHTCVGTCSQPVTLWQQNTTNWYQISGDCIVGGL